MTDDHFDVFERDLPEPRWCERCTLKRLSDCSIVCFAQRHDEP